MNRQFAFKTTAEQVTAGLDLKGKTAVVTGGNSGIGLETCRVLAKAGVDVYLCARNKELGEVAVKAIRDEVPEAKVNLHILNLADLFQVHQSADALLGLCPCIDMVICNAGIMALPDLQRTPQGFEMQSGVNWLGHMHFVNCLLPRMKEQKAPSRIVLVSSLAHMMSGFDINDLNWEKRKYSQWGAYGQSKMANILHGKQLAKMLEGTPIRVFSLHPGNIKTNLSRNLSSWMMGTFFMLGPWLPKPLKTKNISQGAATQVYAATAPELESFKNGEYLDDCKVAVPKLPPNHEELAAKLWAAGEEFIQKALAASPPVAGK